MVEPSRDGDSGKGTPGSGTTVRESMDGDWNMQSMCGELQTFHPDVLCWNGTWIRRGRMEPGLDEGVEARSLIVLSARLTKWDF